jgi:hypothetical protein
MPNPLGRRRGPAAGSSSEVEQLKKELADLRSSYVQDMALISNDMTQLENKIAPADSSASVDS